MPRIVNYAGSYQVRILASSTRTALFIERNTPIAAANLIVVTGAGQLADTKNTFFRLAVVVNKVPAEALPSILNPCVLEASFVAVFDTACDGHIVTRYIGAIQSSALP